MRISGRGWWESPEDLVKIRIESNTMFMNWQVAESHYKEVRSYFKKNRDVIRDELIVTSNMVMVTIKRKYSVTVKTQC